MVVAVDSAGYCCSKVLRANRIIVLPTSRQKGHSNYIRKDLFELLLLSHKNLTRMGSKVVACQGCWGEYNSNSTRDCPENLPYVSGDTTSCGCMNPYHGKVCTEQRCCRETYECYGNCGNFDALYIFLGVLGVASIGVGIYYFAKWYMKEKVDAAPQAKSTEKVVEIGGNVVVPQPAQA